MTTLLPEDEPSEVLASRYIVELLRYTLELQEKVEAFSGPPPNSPLDRDARLCPELKVHQYASAQLSASLGSFFALYRVLGIREEDESQTMTAHLHGGYDLIRNGLEAAAHCLWMLEPNNSRRRVLRRLGLQWDEWVKAEQFAAQVPGGQKRDFLQKKLNLVSFANRAGITDFADTTNPEKMKTKKGYGKPTATDLLETIERWNPETRAYQHGGRGWPVPWLAVWQLCSGFAHGKAWPMLGAHVQERVPIGDGEQDEHDVQLKLVISFKVMANCLEAAVTLLQVSVDRFLNLTRPGAAAQIEPRGLPTHLAEAAVQGDRSSGKRFP